MASSVESSAWSNSWGGRAATFWDDFRDSLGAFPGSRVTVISPPMISSSLSSDLGVWLALCFLTGDWEEDFLAAGVDDRDRLKPLGVGASYVPLSAIVFSASEGKPSSSSFISLSAASTTSGFVSRVSSAIFETFQTVRWCCGSVARLGKRLAQVKSKEG
jgi:hypothetical protein